MSQNYLVVDGHSVIHAWPELRTQHQRQPRQAREHLMTQLRVLHDTSNWGVTLIFDGRHGTPPVDDKAGFIVRYSQAGQTADSVIEGLVAGQPEKTRPRISVITADQAERHVVESLGAICYSPEWLKLEMEQQSKTFSGVKLRIHNRAKW